MSIDVADVKTWVPDLTTFAARLAVVRNRMGWNAKEAALACGLPATSWRNWEAGKRPHDLAEVCTTIARRTGVPAAWLAFGPDGLQHKGYQRTTSQYVPEMFAADQVSLPSPRRQARIAA